MCIFKISDVKRILSIKKTLLRIGIEYKSLSFLSKHVTKHFSVSYRERQGQP